MAQSFTFDGINKVIELDNTSSFTVKEMYSSWKQWVTANDNSKFLQAFRTVGGDPLSPGRFLGSTYFLVNGWQIRPFSDNHRLQVEGNLFHDDLIPPFLPASGSFSVIVESAVSNLTETNVVTGSGGGGSLDPETNQRIVELWQIHGLDPTASVYVSKFERLVGNVSQSISSSGTSSFQSTTITRIP
jgi:hypothetical protein